MRLIDEASVGLAPGTAFGAGGERFLRLCFARNAEQLEAAVGRVAAVLSAGGIAVVSQIPLACGERVGIAIVLPAKHVDSTARQRAIALEARADRPCRDADAERSSSSMTIPWCATR